MPTSDRTVPCACGNVALAVTGPPIVTLVCYCDTCQEGSSRIEALPDAHPVREADGGTAYVSYRKDRVKWTRGEELLADYRLEGGPKTNRVVASCCNSAMIMRFDDARHWVAIYRERFGPKAPPVEMRICTSFMRESNVISGDVPSSPMFPPALLMKLLGSRLAMLFHV